MNKFTKIAITILLLAAAAGLIIIKEQGGTEKSESGPAPGSGQGGSLPKMIDLGAGKCIPCKKMAPILEEIRTEYRGALEIEFIDVWKNPPAGRKYGIRLIPTQIFYDAAGKELTRHTGFMGKEDILGTFRRFGVKLERPKRR